MGICSPARRGAGLLSLVKNYEQKEKESAAPALAMSEM